MSGILAAIELQKAGFDPTVFEKADRMGGTWRDNTYPGSPATCLRTSAATRSPVRSSTRTVDVVTEAIEAVGPGPR
jgi:monoamine oxidase